MDKKYVAYYRVSTAKQGASGLGLEAQQYAVTGFLKEGKVAGEYVEVESGKKNNRPQLLAAIEHTRKTKGTLIIAKLDRLSRNAAFIFTLKDSGVDFICADMPDANTLTIGIFAVMAQHERELISGRTKAALQQIKHKIETEGWAISSTGKIINKLGNPVNLTYEHRLAGGQAVKQKAALNENNKRAAAVVKLYRAQGLNWLAIASKLNEDGFRTSRGGSFQAVQVQRIFNRV